MDRKKFFNLMGKGIIGGPMLLSGLSETRGQDDYDEDATSNQSFGASDANPEPLKKIELEPARMGKAFEGFGALSAGASSRLLYDYAEPYRSDILDYLFKPGFGANIHHLKVEIGGDINSTDGSEPSIAATREEFENPREGFFRRGYEYWLMAEAKKRNPDILLEGLQWGAPGWVGNGEFCSSDNARLVCAWIEGAEKYWDLSIDYVGIRNERAYTTDYIKLLRRMLDTRGLQYVKITAGDKWRLYEKWAIADDILNDKELDAAIHAINAHTVEELNFETTESAKKTGKPMWSGESHFYGTDWYHGVNWARAYRSYVSGSITKIISWSLISSYHDYLPVPNSGLMKANTPRCGHYEVQFPIWVLAHINQFARPGWKYLDSATKFWGGVGSLQEGLSVTTLMDPDSRNYSVIIEKMDAKEPQQLLFEVPDSLPSADLTYFRSVFKKEAFERQDPVKIRDGKFSLVVQPNAIYSLSSTRGQQKGSPSAAIPPKQLFPPAYFNDFENQKLHSPAKYFSDQNGTFEVVEKEDGTGRMLRQVSV